MRAAPAAIRVPTPEGEGARPIVVAVLLLLLLGLPHHRLFLWLSDSFPVKYWKEIVFAVGCIAFASTLARRGGLNRVEVRGIRWAAPFVLAVIVRMAVGAVRGEPPHLLVVGGGSRIYYVPIFLLAVHLLETSLAAVLSVADNLLHFSGRADFFGRSRVESTLDYDAGIWRSSATYQSPMHLGMIAGTGFLVSLFLFVTRLRDRVRSSKRLLVFGALMALHLVGLYLTFSRGPLVATAGGAAVLGVFGNRGLDWRRITAGWRRIAVGAAATGLVMAVVILLLPPALQQHLGSIFDWSGDQNNTTRVRRMTAGLERIQEAPWIGQGLGSAQVRLANYRFEELGREFFFTNPESQLLSWTVEGGLMLLLPALLVVGFMIHTAFTLASQPERPDLRRLGVLFLGLQAALYAEGLIMTILDNRTFQLGFWVLFGVLVYFRDELDGSTAVGRASPERECARAPSREVRS